MTLDIQSPKVTWSVVFAVVGMIFSTGMLWNKMEADAAARDKSIAKQAESIGKQWHYINQNTTKVDTLSQFATKMPQYEASNRELRDAILSLTEAAKYWSKREERRDLERQEDLRMMQSLSEQVTEIKVEVGQLKAIMKK